MSLKNKYKTDLSASNEGIWTEFHNEPNADGSVPAFKLARMSKQNKKFLLAQRRAAEKNRDPVTGAERDMSAEEKEQSTLDVFLDTTLLDWRNFQPDDNGVVLPYTRANAEALFKQDEWYDLYLELLSRASNITNFTDKARKEEAKNS